MATDVPYTFTEAGARRIVDAVRRVEREPRPRNDQPQRDSRIGTLGAFVVASDPSDYDEAEGLLPLGYRGHVIAYRIIKGYDLTTLPKVLSLDKIWKNRERSGEGPRVATWYSQPWPDQYADNTLGRPVLVNVCRYASGQFFRGQVISAGYLPGFRCAGQYRGTDFGWAAPTYGEWPSGVEPASPIVSEVPGWCAISDGFTEMDFQLSTELDTTADTPYATGTPETTSMTFNKTLGLPVLGDVNDSVQQYIYSNLAVDDPIPEDSIVVAVWSQLQFRWRMVAARCP